MNCESYLALNCFLARSLPGPKSEKSKIFQLNLEKLQLNLKGSKFNAFLLYFEPFPIKPSKHLASFELQFLYIWLTQKTVKTHLFVHFHIQVTVIKSKPQPTL